MPSVLLSEGSERTSGNRCTGTWVASRSPLPVPTDSVIIPSPSQSEEKGTENDTGSSAVAREILADRDHSHAVRRAMVPAAVQRSSVTGRGGDFLSSSRTPGTVGLASEWLNMNAADLPDCVLRTIQNSRALSTRSLYECKWGVFERWCTARHEIPFQCLVAVILSFLQDQIDQGKAFSTIKVFLVAKSAKPTW